MLDGTAVQKEEKHLSPNVRRMIREIKGLIEDERIKGPFRLNVQEFQEGRIVLEK